MHINHYFRVKAKNHEDAQREVFEEVVDWGNEDNWKTILGSMDENGRIDIPEVIQYDSRWSVEEILTIIAHPESILKRETDIDLWTESINEGEYDVVGLTPLYHDSSKEGEMYIVAIDMHK